MHSLRMQSKLFAGIFALIFIRSFEQGERVHKAMISRGFSGTYSVSTPIPHPAMTEYVVLGFMVIAVTALAVTSWRGFLL
jgi:cobalt/nickel transport system permease protein